MLYPEKLPERGNICVEFSKEYIDDGVIGVIANVVSLITGAAADGGFKGIAGAFETAEFRQLWQERVRSLLLDHAEYERVFSAVASVQ